MEEANAAVDVLAPYCHLDIPVIGQTYLIYRASLRPPHTFSAGPESADVQLFDADAIPWKELAFSSVYMTLQKWVQDKAAGRYSMQQGVIRKKAGASPRDPDAFEFGEKFSMACDEDVRDEA